jgi:hypothetical protein
MNERTKYTHKCKTNVSLLCVNKFFFLDKEQIAIITVEHIHPISVYTPKNQ